jgi:hypothetical protein
MKRLEKLAVSKAVDILELALWNNMNHTSKDFPIDQLTQPQLLNLVLENHSIVQEALTELTELDTEVK